MIIEVCKIRYLWFFATFGGKPEIEGITSSHPPNWKLIP